MATVVHKSIYEHRLVEGAAAVGLSSNVPKRVLSSHFEGLAQEMFPTGYFQGNYHPC
jgi:hypothetical protein